MNVVFLSTRAPFPPDTGHYQRTYNILRQLARFARVRFFGFYDKRTGPEAASRVDRALGELCAQVHIEHLAVERSRAGMARLALAGLVGGKPLVARKYLSPTLARAVAECVAGGGIDLAHLDMLPLAEYLPFLGALPVVLTNHNVESLRLARWARVERNPVLKAYLKVQTAKLARYEADVVGRLGHCIVVSRQDGEYLARFNPRCRFHVIPNGADLKHYAPVAGDGGGQTILWVGSMADPYNRAAVVHFAERIFGPLLARVPDLKWVVVGKHPPPAVTDLARAHPAHVELAGFVDDVRPFYGRADVLVVPLLSGSGTKLKVVEGLAMGMPIVTTSIGAEGLETEDGVHLRVADDPAAFGAAVADLLGDPAGRRRLGEAARRLAEARYDWDRIGHDLEAAYRQVLAG